MADEQKENILKQTDDGSDMDDDAINQLVNETIPTATKRSTLWGLKVFNYWLQKRNISIDLKDIPAAELAAHLKKFYAEVKKQDGQLYTPSGLVGIRAAIHRALIAPPNMRNINILEGEEFIAANRVFVAKCKIYTARGNAKPKHKPTISATDMTKIKAYFDDHNANPTKLQEFIWFTLCYYFGRRGREGWRESTVETFVIKKDEDSHEYITDGVTMTTKNHQGGSKVGDNDYSDARLYNDCVIQSYRLFLTKRHPENPALFQTPLNNFQHGSETWYKKEPMGKNYIGNIMRNISNKAGLSIIYTPHSIRASMISILFQAGVQPKEICAITKHKRESGLDPYISGSSSAQKRQCSDVLSSALGFQNEENQMDGLLAMSSDEIDNLLHGPMDASNALVASNAETTVSNQMAAIPNAAPSVLQINESISSNIQSNFELVVPGFDWQEILRNQQPVVNISNCQVSLNFSSNKQSEK